MYESDILENKVPKSGYTLRVIGHKHAYLLTCMQLREIA